jgi:hypothetical protein
MTRRFGRLALILTVLGFVAIPAVAENGASVSGHVKDSSGKAQMGALVEIFAASMSSPVKVYTDDRGFYTAGNLVPGIYLVKATAAAFLPSVRQNVSVRSNANTLVNLTLNTLIEAFQLIPSRRGTAREEDDWKWTLTANANRPILRVLEDDGPLVVVSDSEQADDRVLKAKVAFIAGSNGESFSGSDMHTAFTVEQSIFRSGTMSFDGSVGYNGGQANGVVRASYRHELANGSHPEFTFTAHRFASPESAVRRAALSAMTMAVTDGFTIADFIDLNYGGEMQSIQYRGRVTAFRPFASVAAHLSPDAVVEYRYTTSRPTTRLAKGFDTAPADLTETNPRVALVNHELQLERSSHQEVAFSQRLGKNNFQAAYYLDRLRNTALTGVGEIDDLFFATGDFLPDVYSNTFTYNADDFRAQGLRLVAQRKFSDSLTGTINYSFGGALELADAGTDDTALFRSRQHHAVTTKFAGTVPKAHTRWIASYKWSTGSRVVTPIDLFNVSAGGADPYFNVFVRQPLPGMGFLPGKVEALVDVRNLLSQGYVPLIGRDGNTLYLVQSARAIRGGVAFNF